MRRHVYTLLFAVVPLMPVSLWAQQQEPLKGFVPVDQLPPADQLPAAPLLIAAYTFVWFAVLAYVWSVWRRMNRVESELRALHERR
jgi:CcmD family protein